MLSCYFHAVYVAATKVVVWEEHGQAGILASILFQDFVVVLELFSMRSPPKQFLIPDNKLYLLYSDDSLFAKRRELRL